MQSQKQQNDLSSFPRKPFNITVIQVYFPTSNAEKAEAERFYEDLQDFLELTPRKDVLFIIGYWNAKGGIQETPGVTGKFGLGIWNEAGPTPVYSHLMWEWGSGIPVLIWLVVKHFFQQLLLRYI